MKDDIVEAGNIERCAGHGMGSSLEWALQNGEHQRNLVTMIGSLTSLASRYS